MAKMFYSLEEAANKLGKSESEVRQMAANGEITEFRDGDKLIFKVDQIDLLAGDEDDTTDQSEMSSMIPLADTSAGDMSGMAIDLTDSEFGSGEEEALDAEQPGAEQQETEQKEEPAAGAPAGGEDSGSVLGLEASGSAAGLGDTGGGAGDDKERTGISVFDADDMDEADPSAATLVSDSAEDTSGLEAINLDTGGSGSGLMDLTRESDDTSLGAEGLLDDIFSGEDTGAGMAAGETVAEEDTGLFEGAGSVGAVEEEEGAPAGAGVGGAVMAGAVEAYDPKGSAMAFGMMLVAVLAMAGALALSIMWQLGAPLTVPMLNENLLYATGGAAGLAIILGVVFMIVAKKG